MTTTTLPFGNVLRCSCSMLCGIRRRRRRLPALLFITTRITRSSPEHAAIVLCVFRIRAVCKRVQARTKCTNAEICARSDSAISISAKEAEERGGARADTITSNDDEILAVVCLSIENRNDPNAEDGMPRWNAELYIFLLSRLKSEKPKKTRGLKSGSIDRGRETIKTAKTYR